jgi:LPXTG-site transpeptidase (sortase) family protein
VSRLLGILSVALVGVALAVVLENPPTSGEGTGQPAHAEGRTTRAREPGTANAARGRAQPREPVPRTGRPRSLDIDALGIRAPVVPVQTSGSRLYPPDDVAKVGWWRDGAMPGAVRGSAVVTGHTVSDGDGVFDHLARLRIGDRVRLVTDAGVLRYVVHAEASYRRTALARRAPQLFSQSGPGRLVLVTCEDWNGEVYLRNRVVVATPG